MSTESTLDELKRSVRLSDADAALLARLRPRAAPYLQRIAEQFYERAREHADTHALFTDEAQILRLQRSLVRWIDRVLAGPWDEAWFDEATRLGRMHVRVGLPQRYVVAAMALLRADLARVADATMDADALATRTALNRALDLVLAVVLEAYCDDSAARIQHLGQPEAQDALQRVDRRCQRAVELAGVPLVGLDAEGKIRLFNRAAERLTGHARDEVLGRAFGEAILGGEAEEQAALLLDAAKGRPIAGDVLDVVIRTRAGERRDVRWQIARPSAEEADEVTLFVTGRDLTDDAALAARVRRSERLAAVGTLASGLAHEIRNPLNGAQLHLTLLARGLEKRRADPDTLDAVRIIADELERLSGFVDVFLDFARPRPLHLETVDLRRLCERAAQLAGPAAAAAKVALALQLPAQALALDLDVDAVAQVLAGLLQNAIEALAPAGGGAITLRLRRLPRHALVEVEDDGPGLANAGAPIFDPFFSTKPSGAGLGLAVAHRIVTEHDGTIAVESAPGKTVFRVLLPLRSTLRDRTEDADDGR